MQAIDAVGFEKPTPVQELAIPEIMTGNDLIACAQTGTGKTAAFVLPLLHSILNEKNRTDTIKALIIAPTRELAVQIDQHLEGFSYFAGVSSIAVYGGGSGTDYEVEKKAIKTGAEILVATPGRLISHINSGYVDFSQLKFLILDEADRMLDMGFIPDIMKIISSLPKKRQTLLFSATMPSDIRGLAKKILQKPNEINLAVSKPAENVLQAAYLVYDNQKIELVKELLTGKDLQTVLIFSATKSSVKELEKDLLRHKFNVKAIHSDLEQDQRKEVLRQFKNREIQILVATDIVSRGIDIDNISLVINYNVPHDAEDYVHRVGRTARAEKTGVAITFINDKETWNFTKIEKLIESEVRKLPLPEKLGKGPQMNQSRPRPDGSRFKGRSNKGKGGFKRKPKK